jgi:hypothetical protein
MRDCKEGYLGKQLPALKLLAEEADEAAWASVLNFDPFAKQYVDRETRDQIQVAWDRSRRGELVDKTVLTPQVLLFGIASGFYLPRSLKLRDGGNALRTLGHLVEDDQAKLDPHTIGLVNLARALASNSFLGLVPAEVATLLSLERTSTDTTVFAASLAVHVAGVLSPEAMATNPLAFYACDPAASRHHFMLATEDNSFVGSVLAALGESIYRYKCECGYIYTVVDCGKTSQSGVCPECHRPIGNSPGAGMHQAAAGQVRIDGQGRPVANVPDEPGYLKHDRTNLGRVEHNLQRSNNAPMSRVGFRVLHVLVHLSLFAYALVNQGADGLLRLMPDEASPVISIWQQVMQDLDVLRQLLHAHAFDEVVAFLHSIIERLPEWCQGRSGALLTAHERNAWEKAFVENFIDPEMPSLQQTLRRCVDEYKRAVADPPRLHREIDEDDTLDKATLFHPSLFAVTSNPSYEILCATFDSTPRYALEHPFLALFLTWQPLLVHVQQLWPLVRWYRMLREHWGNALSRKDAGEMTVGKLLEQMSVQLGAGVIFDEFANAWNAVVQGLRRGGA